MRYSKTHVNEIIDQILKLHHESVDNFDPFKWHKEIDLIREEHLLVDQRKSALPEYTGNILRDFLEFKLSYKDIMRKYHCSMRTLKTLLLECSEDDPRVYEEMELRRH